MRQKPWTLGGWGRLGLSPERWLRPRGDCAQPRGGCRVLAAPVPCMQSAWRFLAAPALAAATVCSACHAVLGVSVAAVTIRPHGSQGCLSVATPTLLLSAHWSPEKRSLGGGMGT